MTVNFPEIQPTGCTFTPPSYPVTESSSQSGVKSYRIWSSKPSDGILDLGFENISELNADLILSAYIEAKGPIGQLLLPPIIFSGMTNPSLLEKFSQSASGLGWFFLNGEPPPMERVPGRRLSTRVRLRAELRFS